MKSSTHLRDRLGPDAAGCHRSGLRGRGPGAVLQDGLDVETRRDRTVSPAHAGVSVSWFSCCTTRLDLLPSKAATVVTGSLPSRYAPRILAPAGAHPFGIGRWCSHKPTMPEEEAQAEAQVDGCEEPPTGAAADSHGSAEEEASAEAAGAKAEAAAGSDDGGGKQAKEVRPPLLTHTVALTPCCCPPHEQKKHKKEKKHKDRGGDRRDRDRKRRSR